MGDHAGAERVEPRVRSRHQQVSARNLHRPGGEKRAGSISLRQCRGGAGPVRNQERAHMASQYGAWAQSSSLEVPLVCVRTTGTVTPARASGQLRSHDGAFVQTCG
eukprot:5035230-Pleurochrysis_carterae.AAC.1